ncbi:MAG: hypothetical protein ACP5I1_00055 [Candidatus Hinthialibacter sp.]
MGHKHPEQSIPPFQCTALLIPFQYDKLAAQCNVPSGQIRDDIELTGEPTSGKFDDLEHH